MSVPLVTCIMPTADRRPFVAQAIRYFLAQDYPEKELVIVDDGADTVGDLVPSTPNVRYFHQAGRQPVGKKRNFACQNATGRIIVHWDDDDWSAPSRLRAQVEALVGAQADICGMDRVWLYSPAEERAWEYVYPPGQRRWVYGATLGYTRDFWRAHPFPDLKVGEDTRFVWAEARAKIHVMNDPSLMVALVHRSNTSPKRTGDGRYHPKPLAEVEALFGADLRFYRDLAASGARKPVRAAASVTAPSRSGRQAATPIPAGASETSEPAKPSVLRRGRALITASRGIGDILRVTPLIRVAQRLGYEVDVLIETDYAEAAELLAGAPEIRRLFHQPSPRRKGEAAEVAGLAGEEYDVATFTFWSSALRGQIRARRTHQFERETWLAEGDSRSVARLARELGWAGELPPAFAMASDRQFQLPPGTVAVHPGCKYEWPWKKWHGFGQLAARFANVAVVGSPEDRRTDNTYFKQPFVWPAHARDFTGQLGLADTAALLRQCTALIANDSGLMHLGVALGVPSFGIFGITSPAREAMFAPHFHPLTKGLPCEAACRRGAWGRRDCDRHLECLKTLTPDEVHMKVTELLPAVAGQPRKPVRIASPPESIPEQNQTINLTYYGWVFDASGYGNAARGYIHALNRAGVNLSVVDLANRPRQVADPLVESLVGRKVESDFHLFHGVPPFWSRQAFPLRNVIAMTVWETDTMPPQWRPALNHALEVWLPSEFNISVFGRALERPVFKLPHALLPGSTVSAATTEAVPALGIRPGDFVFYSIFEWQERKGPREMVEAFLRAFPDESGAVMLLKSNPGAAGTAAALVRELRGRTNSSARVEIRCEAWSEAQISALHDRGNCYVSLHHGEGWNLPLFEAACRGRPAIATGFSGPLEFLAGTGHALVRHQSVPVRQRYAYYVPSMRWAEPDVAHAVELMRGVLREPKAAGERAAAAAEKLRDQFSLERVGAAARQRLLHLLRRTHPAKWQRLQAADRLTRLKPAIPIPGEWYDADYFEHGLKSNWRDGYKWDGFAGLFRETAEFLTGAFPDAKSFLDAGCAKGFLVRALRERGADCWGFDHSVWALARAEESAKPFLRQASTDDAHYEERRDMLLAFSLLESLTEEQALSFLGRARGWTRHGLLAVIHTEAQPPLPAHADDHDLTRITLRSRAWWHELMQRAGWRQDPLHKAAERICQNHPLPRKMGWEIFLYSAGA